MWSICQECSTTQLHSTKILKVGLQHPLWIWDPCLNMRLHLIKILEAGILQM